MNLRTEKPWSAAMVVALDALAMVGAAVCAISLVGMVEQGSAVFADVARAAGGGVWAVIILIIRRHPDECRRYLQEKF